MYKFLEHIQSPADLENLSLAELDALAAEIRAFLIEHVSKTGGHLASNLGIVELTIALHRVLDLPLDKIVWDVGHQAYVHKILTGRRDAFSTLRQLDGLSGFPKTRESAYDCFNTGHSSTSVSAALGLARARDLSGKDYTVAAVIGDGALTGGMAYEALNDAGHSKTKMLVILNDNEMSISENVGAISRHLRNLRTKPGYFRSKQVVEDALNRIPLLGKPIATILRYMKKMVRSAVLPTNLFQDLGFHYVGPVDGHDISKLISALETVKNFEKPVLLHVLTKKGKGYRPAELYPEKFHGVAPFHPESGKPLNNASTTYSDVFGDTLVQLAEMNDRIIAITGAMPAGTGLLEFRKKYRQRFFDVGIAEQHAVTFAAGLAMSGFVPFVPLYSSFLQRAYDQTLHDVCLQNLHVVFPIDRAGIVGRDGETHHGIYDIAFLSHMPNMTILSPSNFRQLQEMLLYAACVHEGPIAIRYPRGNTQGPGGDFRFGRAEILEEGDSAALLATGRMTETAVQAADILEQAGIRVTVLSFPTIQPLDKRSILQAAARTKLLITIEDHVLTGGFGSLVASALAEEHTDARLICCAFPDEPIPHGAVEELDRLYGLDAESIAEKIRKAL